jgi:HupE/UreJ protein
MRRAQGWRWRTTASVVVAVGIMWHGLAQTATGHWADLAVAEIAIGERQVDATLTFPTGLVRYADADRDGTLSATEVDAHRERLTHDLSGRVRVTDGVHPGALAITYMPAPATMQNLRIETGSHSALRLTYTWPARIKTANLHYGFFETGISTASCLATILQNGRVRSVVFTPENRDLAVPTEGTSVLTQVKSFVVLGIEHILTGYDHVLFLLSLLMLGGGLGYLMKTVSAFTIAHSITLSLAVLGAVRLPGQWVESAIALSIVYVAIENFWRKEAALGRRWLVTFGFGLVHGLGFASILAEFAIQRRDLAVALASFNAGVEIGQVAIVAVAFVILQMLRRWPAEIWVRRLVSAGAAAAGLVWFVQRALLS